MAEPPRFDLELPGCTPEPLMAYLKALGILRLVSEQKDLNACAWWKDDTFWLRSTLDRDALVMFLLTEYRPTPLFSPWNGDGGFLSDSGTSVETIAFFRAVANPRFQAIRDAITAVEQIPLMSEFRQKRDRAKELGKKKKAGTITKTETEELREVTSRVKRIKQTAVTGIRAGFSDTSLGWLDSCLTIGLDGVTASPLLGSGGVDGRLDFGNNFLVNCRAVLPDAEPTKPRLKHALFDEAVELDESSIGQFSPGQVGAPNSTQGFEGVSLINLWDFILMMEGTVMLAGAAVRRLGITGSARAAFPFTVRAVAAGFDSPASKDEAESRGELWLPLWTRPTSAGELRQLFGEGRAEVSGRAARDGADFARAVASLGVDRGISGFSRLGFLKRSGKAFLAAPLGRFEVVERTGVDLLREVDSWLERFRRAACDKNVPPRFGSALRRIDSAIFEFCRFGGKSFFQSILIAIGRAERELALTPGKVGTSKWPPGPLAGLSAEWIDAAKAADNDEFVIACALASAYDPERKIGPLRTNLEPVTVWRNRDGTLDAKWAEEERCVVWNAGDLSTRLAAVLARRVMDGERAGCEYQPLASRFTAPLDAVAAFIAGEFDDERIADLVWGLMLIDARSDPSRDRQGTGSLLTKAEGRGGRDAAHVLSRAYALLKLLFLPRPLVPERSGEKVKWRLARRLAGGHMEGGLVTRPESRILSLLRAERIGEACQIAAQRLRISGLLPMPGPVPGRSTGMLRDNEWSESCVGGVDPRRGTRLAAALLIPVSSKSVNRLVQLVCRDESAAAGAVAVAAEGESE